MALRFEQELDVRLAAAELGLEPDDFRERLARLPELARALAGQTIKRDTFVRRFEELVVALRIGRYVAAKWMPATPG